MDRLFLFAAAVVGVALGAQSSLAAKPAPTLEGAVLHALAMFEEMDTDALRAQAELDNPDPWVVTDELLAVNREAALAFAKASTRPATDGLAVFIENDGPDSSDKTRRALLRKARAQREARELDAALVTLSKRSRESPPDILDVRLAYLEGRVLLDLLRHADGAMQMRRARTRAEAIGWLARASSCAEHEARGCIRRSDFAGALVASKAWLDLEKQLGSKRGAGRAEGLLAMVHSRRAEIDTASTYAERALAVGRETGDAELVALMLSVQARLALRAGRTQRARELYEESLKTIATVSYDVPSPRFTPDPAVVRLNRGAALVTTGSFAFHFGERALAWQRLAAAEELARDANNPRLMAQVHQMAGSLREKAGQPNVAATHYEEAVDAYRAMDDRTREAQTLRYLAGLQARMGNARAALTSLDRALKTQEALGVREEVGALQIARGDVLKDTGETERAAKAYAEAEAIGKQAELPRLESDASNALGSLYLEAGRYAESISCFQRSLSVRRQMGDTERLVYSLCELMRVYAATGDLDRADALFKEGERILRDNPSDRSAARLYIQYGRVLLQMENVDDGAAMLERGLVLAQAARLQSEIAIARSSLASVSRARKAWNEAVRHADAAASIYAALKQDRRAAGAEISAAMAKAELGRLEDARKQLTTRLAKATKAGTADVIVQCHWGLALIALRDGDYQAAMGHARDAMKRMRSIGRFLAEGQGAAARAMSAPVFRLGAAAALGAKDDVSLYEFLEEGRAGTLLAALDAREILQTAAVPKRLRDAEDAARREEARALRRFEAVQARGGARAVERARDALVAASLRLRDAMEEIQREVRTAAGLVYPDPATRAQVMAALRPDEALLLCGVLEDRVVVLVLRRDGQQTVTLGAASTLRDTAAQLLRLGRKPGARGLELDPVEAPVDTAQAAATLRRLLVDPLGLDERIKRVLIAPDGFLAYVPFALLMPDLQIAYTPSASVYMRLLDERDLRGDGVLALGDPEYAGRNLAPLPATRREAHAVGSEVWVGKDASETRFRERAGSKKRWRAINLACHGRIDPQRPTLSSLVLTSDGKNDGYLTALDVFGLRAPADLVVLSACETAKGKIVSGEGVVGLTRAFMFAGTPRVLCSLWRVDDEATQALMIEFYALWNPKDGKGLGAAAALKRAQAYVKGHGKWQHPYYWAAWVLWGLPD